MGSGKSFILNSWSKQLGIEKFSLDFDQEIISRSDYQSIPEMIEKKSWEFFRERESLLLKETLKARGGGLYSLGGGTLSPLNLLELKESRDACLLWVDTAFSTCWERIKDDGNRPLVKKGYDLCLELFKEREVTFRQSDYFLSKMTDNEIKKIHLSLQNSCQN